MTNQLAEGNVARLLIVLGLFVFLGLLPFAWVDLGVAIVLLVVGLGLAVGWPRGNRMLGYGIAMLGALLAVAGFLEARAILNALTVLVAAVLLIAAWFKHQGKW